MALFSERYKYITPNEALIREAFPDTVANGICSCYDELKEQLERSDRIYAGVYDAIEEYLWVFFLNKRKSDFSLGRYKKTVATDYLLSDDNQWFKKLDLIESSIKFLYSMFSTNQDGLKITDAFVKNINMFFKRLYYSYRIVDKEIVEITSKEEIVSIETALHTSKDNIRKHISTALALYAQKPVGDYRNSIKESISAVEAYCRERTGENTLGKALDKIKKSGCVIPDILIHAFEKLYAYTNQPDNGIRHALMDENGAYIPGQEEAQFMLVSCSSFLNYLYGKSSKTTL